ncbi:MAG: hypothetical protein WCO07_01030 [bacterium]
MVKKERNWGPNPELNQQATRLEDGSLVFRSESISSLYFPSVVFDDRPEAWKRKK